MRSPFVGFETFFNNARMMIKMQLFIMIILGYPVSKSTLTLQPYPLKQQPFTMRSGLSYAELMRDEDTIRMEKAAEDMSIPANVLEREGDAREEREDEVRQAYTMDEEWNI